MDGQYRRLVRSAMAPWALVVFAVITTGAAIWPVPGAVVGVLVLLLVVALVVVGWERTGPLITLLAVVAVLCCAVALREREAASVWIALIVAVALGVGATQDAIHERVVPRARAVNLPGVPSDPRPHEPGKLAPVVPGTAALLALLLIAGSIWSLPDAVDAIVLVLVVIGVAVCCRRLVASIRARRDGSVDARMVAALQDYAPEFYVYFSGPVDGDYQVRMWLPYLERVGVPFAILARNPEMLPRAAQLTDMPLISCPRITGLDACMVPSVRAVFYVNSHGECADAVRYLDRVHIELNHGDSDKPSSYHPIFAMFDRTFVAGQAAIDRFARHGVAMPEDKFVIVGRPQVAAVVEGNLDPLPGCRTVLYAPTWQSGVREMGLSSMGHGEKIVQALLDSGARVIFRPHPLSRGQRSGAALIARIDALLESATTSDRPHLTSALALQESVIDNFNRSDAMVSDISSVPSDYLASCKPVAVALPAGCRADPAEYPMLRAAYLLDPEGEMSEALAALLDAEDVLLPARRELRTYFLGDGDSVQAFVDAARSAVGR